MLKHVPNCPDPGSSDHKTYPIYFISKNVISLMPNFRTLWGGHTYLGDPPQWIVLLLQRCLFKICLENKFHHSSFTSTMEVIKMKVYLGNYI